MLWLKLAHVLLFVYWLGGDLGTLYASRWVRRPALGAAERLLATRIMLGLDMTPRLCMPLVLPTGVHLAVLQERLALTAAEVGAVWLLGLVWLGLAWSAHHYSGQALGARLARIDYGLRVALIAALVAAALACFGLGGDGSWVGAKLLVLAFTIVGGLLIRRFLQPFIPAYAALAIQAAAAPAQPAAPATSLALAEPMRRCVPWVLAIWAALVLNAALGLHLLP